jgi:hypothetical protein
MRGWKGGVSRGEGLGSGLGGVEKLRCSQQSKAFGWGWWGYYQSGPSAGLGGGLGGVEKLRCSQQSKAFGWGWWGLLPVQAGRLGWVAGWAGSKKLRCSQQSKAFGWAGGLLPVRTFGWAGARGGRTILGAVGLYNSGWVRRELMAEVAA